MTDPMPTRHQNFLSIMDKLTGLPQDVDHNGRSADERAARAEHSARFLEASPYAFPEQPEPPAVGMRPNPAQGHGGAPASPTGSGGSLLDRMRANAAKALEAGDGAA